MWWRLILLHLLVFDAAEALRLLPDTGPLTRPPSDQLRAVLLLAMTTWVAALLARRCQAGQPARAMAVGVATTVAVVVADWVLMARASAPGVPADADRVAMEALTLAVAVWLCWLVVRDLGLPLPGLLPTPRRAPAASWEERLKQIDDLATAAMIAVMLPLAAAAFGMALRSTLSQDTPVPSGAGEPDFVLRAVSAGLLEETTMVAVVAVLMTASRRPIWQIIVASAALRLIPHAYYGTDVVFVIPFAVAQVWTYLRTGWLWPLITAHTVFNLYALNNRGAPLMFAVPFLAVFVALVMIRPHWLPARTGPHAPCPAPTGPPRRPALIPRPKTEQ
ncbi:CPBP family intramembrane glutamic endopeptidase [Spirillospora sp. NPDC127200]